MIACACFATGAAAPVSAGRALDPADPIDNLTIERAMGCGSTDVAQPQFYFWTGKVYSRRAGEQDQHLFNVQGVNPRACQIVNDQARGGTGYKAAARELMLYLDPATNEVLESWRNAWTGETVDVVHMLNDPASMPAFKYPFREDGSPTPFRLQWNDMGEYLMAGRTMPFFRDNPMGGDYQDFVGGQYHVMETSSMIIQKASIEDYEEGERIPYVAAWTRLSQWLPWMKMGGREGMIVVITQGRSTQSFADLPDPLRTAIENDYPLMKRTPDFDDPRPFVTSWNSIKQWIDGERERQ